MDPLHACTNHKSTKEEKSFFHIKLVVGKSAPSEIYVYCGAYTKVVSAMWSAQLQKIM